MQPRLHVGHQGMQRECARTAHRGWHAVPGTHCTCRVRHCQYCRVRRSRLNAMNTPGVQRQSIGQAQAQAAAVSKRKRTITIVVVIVVIVVVIVAGVLLYLYVFKAKSTTTTSSTSTTTANMGQSCTATPCAVGLTCDLGVCKQQIGGSCGASGELCPSAALCVARTDDNTGKCRSATFGGCTTTLDCAASGPNGNVCVSGICQIDPSCTTNDECGTVDALGVFQTTGGCIAGTCTDLTALDLGSSCNPSIGDFCYPPMSCTNGTCVLPAGSGTCTGSPDCAPLNLCIAGVCMGALGASCSATSQCIAPNTCVGGICQPPATCSVSTDCGTLFAGIQAFCSAGTCATVWP